MFDDILQLGGYILCVTEGALLIANLHKTKVNEKMHIQS